MIVFQVQWNLFRPMSYDGSKDTANGGPTIANNAATHANITINKGAGANNSNNTNNSSNTNNKMYHVWRDIEDNYQKHYHGEEGCVRPKFYTLTPVDINSQDTPKLDGLVSDL